MEAKGKNVCLFCAPRVGNHRTMHNFFWGTKHMNLKRGAFKFLGRVGLHQIHFKDSPLPCIDFYVVVSAYDFQYFSIFLMLHED